jgi:hypothetical protein
MTALGCTGLARVVSSIRSMRSMSLLSIFVISSCTSVGPSPREPCSKRYAGQAEFR